jgi:ribosomal protein S18 acetylase RimI-like enzyme
MEIRRATENDIEGLVENRMEFIYSIKNIRPPKSFEDLTREYIKENIKNESLVAWVAVDDKLIVSSCILCITQQLPLPISINGKIGYVYNVYTIPKYRRQGLALKLLEQLKEYSVLNGISSLNLTATNDGFELYKKSGFNQMEHDMRLSLQKCPIS